MIKNTTIAALCIMAAVISVIVLPCEQDDASTFYNDGEYSYSIFEDGYAALIGYYGDDTDVIVPDHVIYEGRNLPVRTISSQAFDSDLVSVTIPASVGWFVTESFAGCTSLETVIFEEGIEGYNIAPRMFQGCTSLRSIDLPDSVAYIDEYAFEGCTSLEHVGIPDVFYKIEEGAFSGCTSLKTLDLPSTLDRFIPRNVGPALEDINVYGDGTTYQSVDGVLFSGDTLVAFPAGRTGTYAIPDGATIGEYAFSQTSLHTVDLNGVADIPERCFEHSAGLSDMVIPEGTLSIEEYAFSGCESLARVEIAASVTDVGRYAFNDCTSLGTVWLKGGSPNIEDYAFDGCIDLYEVINDSDLILEAGSWEHGNIALYATTVHGSDVASDNVVLEDGPHTWTFVRSDDGYTLRTYRGPGGDITLSMPFTADGQTMDDFEIHDGLFNGNKSITSVTLTGPLSIPEGLFKDCTGIKTVHVDGPEQVEKHCFEGYTGIETVVIRNVDVVDYRAFGGCTSLRSIDVDNVVELYMESFEDCVSLTDVNLRNLKEFTSNAFSGCSSLETITIPESCTGFTMGGFPGCTSLKEILVENDDGFIRSIDGVVYSFENDLMFFPNGWVGHFSIPEGTKYVASPISAPYMTSLYIPASCTDYWSTFGGCSSLEGIYVHPDNPEFKSVDGMLLSKDGTVLHQVPPGMKGVVVVPDGVTRIDSSALEDCNMSSIIFPDGLESEYLWFDGCAKLESVTLPDSVKKIGSSMFNGCIGLKSVTITADEASLQSGAFPDSPDLVDLHILGRSPTFSVGCFHGCEHPVTIHTPEPIDSDFWGAGTTVNVHVTAPAVTVDLITEEGTFSYDVLPGAPMATPVPDTEGKTIVGWEPHMLSVAPSTDTVYTAVYQAAEYTVTFLVDGSNYATAQVTYGQPVSLPSEPTSPGRVFSHWGGLPETMPARDITVEAVWASEPVISDDGHATVEGFGNSIGIVHDGAVTEYEMSGTVDVSGETLKWVADIPSDSITDGSRITVVFEEAGDYAPTGMYDMVFRVGVTVDGDPIDSSVTYRLWTTVADGVRISAEILNSDGSVSEIGLTENDDCVEFPLTGVKHLAFSRSVTLDAGGGNIDTGIIMIAAVIAVIAVAVIGVVIWRRRSSRS